MDEILKHYKLTEEDCKREVSDSHIEEISRGGSLKDWRVLPSHLALKEILVSDIDRKQIDEKEKRHEFLKQWKQKKGFNATYERLILSLLKIEHRREAEGICKILQSSTQQLSSSTPVTSLFAPMTVSNTPVATLPTLLQGYTPPQQPPSNVLISAPTHNHSIRATTVSAPTHDHTPLQDQQLATTMSAPKHNQTLPQQPPSSAPVTTVSAPTHNHTPPQPYSAPGTTASATHDHTPPQPCSSPATTASAPKHDHTPPQPSSSPATTVSAPMHDHTPPQQPSSAPVTTVSAPMHDHAPPTSAPKHNHTPPQQPPSSPPATTVSAPIHTHPHQPSSSGPASAASQAKSEQNLSVGVSATNDCIPNYLSNAISTLSPFTDSRGGESKVVTTQSPNVFKESQVVTARHGEVGLLHDSDCFSEARAQISGLLMNGCNPIVLTILVTNDNNTKLPYSDHSFPDNKRPLLNAEKSCAIIKSELEDCGIVVIPVINRSMEYLFALLMTLAGMKIPKSCDFLWFIFTGHGSCGQFYVNGRGVTFEDLIQQTSKIWIKYMGFFFECCQLRNSDKIKAAEVKRQYIAVYSAPPNQVSYHCNGVGLMVTCLAEILRDGFTGSFSELQQLLRRKLIAMTTDILAIPAVSLESFVNSHLPVHTSTMFDDFSFYNKTRAAMIPLIDVTMSPGNHTAKISIYNPERIINHPSNCLFELHKNITLLQTDNDGEKTILEELEACFGESMHVVVVMPPQVHQMSGKLMVGAKYRNGQVEYSEPHLVEKLPQYGTPWICECNLRNNQCEVEVSYNPNNTPEQNEFYHIKWAEIGFFTASHEWFPLGRVNGLGLLNCLVTLPPSHHSVKRHLQVAVKYQRCSTLIYSEPYIVVQPPICTPMVKSVKFDERYSLTAILAFQPRQPSPHSMPELYKVDYFQVRSCIEDEKWRTVFRRDLEPGESLQAEEVVVDISESLNLSKKDRTCQSEVILHYTEIGDVRSHVHHWKLKAVDKPEIIHIKNVDAVTATLTFMPYQPLIKPSEYTVCQIKKYSIQSRRKNGEWSIIFEKDVPLDGFLGHEESADIILDLSTDEVLYQYQVILDYCAIGEVRSCVFEKTVHPIESPQIESIDPVDSVTGRLKFLPHQPLSEKNANCCNVDRVQILSQYRNGGWETISDRVVLPNTHLGSEEVVDIPLPLSSKEKMWHYQVILYYGRIGMVRSASFGRKIDPIRAPVIESVNPRSDNFTAALIFSPNQPTSQINPDHCKCSHYQIRSRVRHGNWVNIFTKHLEQDKFLNIEEEVVIPLHLLSEPKLCDYQVIMHYCNIDVDGMRSAVFSSENAINSVGAPHNVFISSNTSTCCHPNPTVSWKSPRSLPAESAIKDDLRYVVVKADTTEEEELASVPVTCNSTEVPGPLSGSVKVGVYNTRKDLGCVFSEPYKRNKTILHLHSIWKMTTNCLKLLLLLLIVFGVALVASIAFLYFSTIHTSQLVVSNQTTPFEPGWRANFSNGVFVTEQTVDFSDNAPNVTGYLVNDVSKITMNETLSYCNTYEGFRVMRQFIGPPPIYLLKGSEIILRTSMNFVAPERFIEAFVYFFDSIDEALRYQRGGSNRTSVHRANIVCISNICNDNFTVEKDAFYFFVLSVIHASVDFFVMAEFNFHAIHYVIPSELDTMIVTRINLNTTGFIPFRTSEVILLYAHPPPNYSQAWQNSRPPCPMNDPLAWPMGHLNFKSQLSFSKPYPLILLIVPSSLFLLTLITIVVQCCCCLKSKCTCHPNTTTVDERTPLLSGHTIN